MRRRWPRVARIRPTELVSLSVLCFALAFKVLRAQINTKIQAPHLVKFTETIFLKSLYSWQSYSILVLNVIATVDRV